MRRKQLIAARERSLARLPITGELLRGSLLERTIRNHARNCGKMRKRRRSPALGPHGQLPWRTYATVELAQRDGLVRRWLANYQRLKAPIEAICEINHDLLRPGASGSTPRRKRRDSDAARPAQLR